MNHASQRDFWQRVPVRRMPPALERRTHIAIADLLRATCRPDWIWSHIANGEHRSEQTGKLLKRMGLRRGLLDFLLISPVGAHHWLELKRHLEPLSDEQEWFVAELRKRRVPYYVARDYDSAVRQLKAWGVL